MRALLIGAVGLALAALGVRLLRLARGAGGEPERWLGLAFVCAGAGAWLLSLSASGSFAHETARPLAVAAQLGLTGAVLCFAAFAWRVFRPDSAAARWLALTLIAANLAAGGALAVTGVPVPVGAVGLVVVLARATALLWLFVESTLYARAMRRRLRLGLADPVVANRFVLWSVWTGALAGIPLFALAVRAFAGLEAPAPGEPLSAALQAVLAVLGLGGGAAAVAVWLAFFPPPAYRRWLVAGAVAPD